MEKRVRVCDICDGYPANTKCIICEKDLCESCAGDVDDWEDLNKNYFWIAFFTKKEVFCDECFKGISIKKLKGFSKMKEEILQNLKDKAILRGLKKKK